MTNTKRITLAVVIAGVFSAVLFVRVIPALDETAPRPDASSTMAMIEALKFRTAAASDTSAALRKFAVGKPLGFITREPLTPARSAAWSTFFAGSLVLLGHVDSPEPVVAYYHPLYDALLTTRWSPKGDAGEMTAATLCVASQFGQRSDQDPPRRPAWLDSSAKKPVPDVLSQNHDRLVQAFERAYPTKATSVAKVPPPVRAEKMIHFIEGQAMEVIRNMIAIQDTKSPLYNEQLRDLRNALVKHEKGTLARLIPNNNPTPMEALLKIPSELYTPFVPAYAVINAADSMVFLQDTLFPRYYMLVFFRKAKAGSKPDIRAMVFFELAEKGAQRPP